MKPDVVAAGNIGCITQLEGSLDVPVVHTVELLDWAYGGPVPRGLEPLVRFVIDVPEPRRRVEDYIDASSVMHHRVQAEARPQPDPS